MFEKNIYLKIIRDNRIEAIYDYSYDYLDSNMKPYPHNYGKDRKGYEKFKRDLLPGASIEHSGVISLRPIHMGDMNIGYVMESKKLVNSAWNIMYETYQRAYSDFKKELNVTDHENFDHWFNDRFETPFDANSFEPGINKLSALLKLYNDEEEPEFRKFINKIKD